VSPWSNILGCIFLLPGEPFDRRPSERGYIVAFHDNLQRSISRKMSPACNLASFAKDLRYRGTPDTVKLCRGPMQELLSPLLRNTE
jgi:hypothetical protein